MCKVITMTRAYGTTRYKVYIRILCGLPYDDLTEHLTPRCVQDMEDTISKYRQVESMDAGIIMKQKACGLPKSTVEYLHRAYRHWIDGVRF